METEITPEQKGQLKTWAGQRDTILLEISGLQTVKEKLLLDNKEIAASGIDTQNQIQQSIGRIEELKKREAELPLLISKDIVSLESQKTCLETEVTNLLKMIEVLSAQKTSLDKDIYLALNTFGQIKDETFVLNKVVDYVTKVSEHNTNVVNDLVSNLKTSIKDLVDINQKNVTETNQVLDKLPRMLVELQKTKLIKNKI